MMKMQIIETAVAVVLFIIIKLVISRYIDTIVSGNNSLKSRSKIVKNGI